MIELGFSSTATIECESSPRDLTLQLREMSFYTSSPHAVRVHAVDDAAAERPLEAARLPAPVAAIIGDMVEEMSPERDGFLGMDVRCVASVDYALRDATEEGRAAARALFGDAEPTIAVSLPVKQALLRRFGGRPSPEQVGAMLGVARAHLVAPYAGRDPDMQRHLVFRDGKLFSTSAVEFVTLRD